MKDSMALQPVRGMRDFLPEQARRKRFIEQALVRVFERYGFQPLQTPVVEELALLTRKGSAGEEIRKEIYAFQDKAGRALGLRFDLTVPLARVAAAHPELKKPFRRYAVGTVYRYDRPQAKRYREFTQADADIVGSSSVLCEYECVRMALDAMDALGVDARVRLNARDVVDALAHELEVAPEKRAAFYRALDKLEKIGAGGVAEALEKDGLDPGLARFFEKASWKEVEKRLEGVQEARAPLARINRLMELLQEAGVDTQKRVTRSPSLVRGLDYYTGIVFEVAARQGPSLGGGGRYDNLVALYGGPPTPAVGISFGVDRILDTVEERLSPPTATQVYVFAVGKGLEGLLLQTAQRLRALGVNVEADVMARGPSKNLAYAAEQGIPFCAILGEKERRQGVLTLKDLATGKQEKIPLQNLAAIQKCLA